MCLEMLHRWSCAVDGDYTLGEDGYIQEPCQCLNPFAGGSWGEWVEENMLKSHDIPALAWVLSQTGKHSLKGCLLTADRGTLLEPHRGNGFLSTSGEAISGAEMLIFNEKHSQEYKSNCVGFLPAQSASYRYPSRDPKESDQVKRK